jgi:hypothetical protein
VLPEETSEDGAPPSWPALPDPSAGDPPGDAAASAPVEPSVAGSSAAPASAPPGSACAGRRESGSTYPWSSEATRTPRWTIPAGPTVPTVWPSATAAPFSTAIDPSWVSVTLYAPLRIAIALPLEGTVPANVTLPPAGARTEAPGGAAMSMPRCWPAAYGCARSKLNPCTTWPVTGQLHPDADGTTTSALTTSAHATLLRICSSVV